MDPVEGVILVLSMFAIGFQLILEFTGL